MAYPKRATNTSPSGRVLAGSANVTKAPARTAHSRQTATLKQKQQTRTPNTISQLQAKQTRHIHNIHTSAHEQVHKKTRSLSTALALTLTLSVPSLFQFVLAIAMAVSVGLFNDTFIAWAAENIGVIQYSAEALYGTVWIISAVLNIMMFLYSIVVFTFRGTRVFTPSALVLLALCLACVLVPAVNIIPWVLIYVWVVALTQ